MVETTRPQTWFSTPPRAETDRTARYFVLASIASTSAKVRAISVV